MSKHRNPRYVLSISSPNFIRGANVNSERYVTFEATTYDLAGDRLFFKDMNGISHVFRLGRLDTFHAVSYKPEDA
jgi:hypothetical protein